MENNSFKIFKDYSGFLQFRDIYDEQQFGDGWEYGER